MWVLKLPPEYLDDAWPSIERSVERRPDDWATLAAVGRYKRYRGDPACVNELTAAADIYSGMAKTRGGNFTSAATMYRLADDDRSTDLYRLAYEAGLARTVGRTLDLVNIQDIIDGAFMLGLDDVCVSTWNDLSERKNVKRANSASGVFALLAEGRLANDLSVCDEAIGLFEALLPKRDKGTCCQSGLTSPYDRLEVALTVRSQVAGHMSDRLFELPG